MASKADIAPAPAYFPTSADSPLHPPTELYERLASLHKSALVEKESFIIPPRSGRAWKVPAGSLFRLSTPQGPQVGDLNIWNASDPRERFWATRTRQLQGSHVKEGDRLWSCLPFMRPLCGVVKDGCLLEDAKDGQGNSDVGGKREEKKTERGGVTKWGVSNMLTGASYDYHCHSNLVRSVLPFGLTEFDVHDVLNVFQVTGLDAEGRYFMEASPATKDSFIEFFAEQDLLCALSTCPGGDLSAWGWHQADEGVAGENDTEEKKDMKSTCRPIKVEVWEIKEDERRDVLRGWKSPERSAYTGMHGIDVPSGEAGFPAS